MERGVILGGILIAASLLFAVLLNRAAGDPVSDVGATPLVAEAGTARAGTPIRATFSDHPGFYAGEAGLDASRRAGRKGCPARSIEETFGFDECPSDVQLLGYVRSWGQTSFDIVHYRRDCPNFRAIEDRMQTMDFRVVPHRRSPICR